MEKPPFFPEKPLFDLEVEGQGQHVVYRFDEKNNEHNSGEKNFCLHPPSKMTHFGGPCPLIFGDKLNSIKKRYIATI